MGFNFAGGFADAVNQIFVQGRTFRQLNLLSIATNSALGGGGIVSNALWGAAGNTFNISVDNVSNGSTGAPDFKSFAAGFAGNMIAGGVSQFANIGQYTVGESVITKLLVGDVSTEIPISIFGTTISNQVEGELKKMTRKNRQVMWFLFVMIIIFLFGLQYARFKKKSLMNHAKYTTGTILEVSSYKAAILVRYSYKIELDTICGTQSTGLPSTGISLIHLRHVLVGKTYKVVYDSTDKTNSVMLIPEVDGIKFYYLW